MRTHLIGCKREQIGGRHRGYIREVARNIVSTALKAQPGHNTATLCTASQAKQ